MENDYQAKYYKTLTQVKEHCYYLQEYIVSYEQINMRIKIFSAITSSGAIACWAVWNKEPFAFIWSIVIALSQVLNAVKDLLPFKRKLSILFPFKQELDLLSLRAEREWFNVAEGKKTNEEIHNLTMEIKSEKTKAEQKYLKKDSLSDKQKLLDKAKEKTDIYIQNNFF